MTEPTDSPRATDRPKTEAAYPAADAVLPGSASVPSTAAAHAAPAHGAATTAHGGHGEEDDAPMGPVDIELWGAGALATAIGLFMAICFVLATAGTGAY